MLAYTRVAMWLKIVGIIGFNSVWNIWPTLLSSWSKNESNCYDKIKQGNKIKTKNSKTLLIIHSNNKKVNLLKPGMWVFEINCNFITRLKILIQKVDTRNWVSAISCCDFMRKEGSYLNYDPHLGNWNWVVVVVGDFVGGFLE
jgi:hypothetical protein